ncbi:MAG: sugar phosphate isomerase/epimerase [Clostridia bacterium]|nr:sugar phosphate isomerase/epimerase [Clostridia bacterium]
MIFLSAFADEAGSKLSEQIEALKRNKISYLELRSVGDVNVKDLTEEQAIEIRKQLDDNGIKVWSIGSPLGKVDIDCDFNEYQKTIEHVCKLANIFGAKKIRSFSFFKAYDNYDTVKKYLSKMVEIANSYGVKICHENEKDVYGDTKERVLELMNDVKGLEFVYDPANYLQVGETAEDTLNLFFDKTSYFHIKDVIKATGELVPAGHGDGNIDGLIKRIEKDTVLTLEPHLKVFGAYASIDNTEMKLKFNFSSNAESFDFAVSELEKILKNNSYELTLVDGVYGWNK